MRPLARTLLRIFLVACTILGVVLLLLSLGLYAYLNFIRPGAGSVSEKEYVKLRKIKVGQTEQEVIRQLGNPHEVVKTLKELQQSASVGHYTYDKKRRITNKVLVYYFWDIVGYVYLDPKGIVEYVFIGGT